MALTALTRERAVAYLKGRVEAGQKTLDTERQAIQAMMVNVTGQLPPGATLPGGLADRMEACRLEVPRRESSYRGGIGGEKRRRGSPVLATGGERRSQPDPRRARTSS